MFNLKSGASASHSANSLKRNVHHAGVARPCCGLLRAAVEAGQVPAAPPEGTVCSAPSPTHPDCAVKPEQFPPGGGTTPFTLTADLCPPKSRYISFP